MNPPTDQEQDENAERDSREEAQREYDRRPRLFRCADRMCGGLDCANCYGEAAVRDYLREQCPHDEHDHGICLCCAKDITDDLVSRAEAAEDARSDR